MSFNFCFIPFYYAVNTSNYINFLSIKLNYEQMLCLLNIWYYYFTGVNRKKK